jgi:hypothetical protein
MTLQRITHAGAAPTTGVATGFSSSATSFSIVSGTGYPTGSGGDFVLKVDGGTASEEKILCSSLSGTTVAVASGGRGWDNTTAASHGTGTTNVEHCYTAAEADDNNDHIYTTTRDDHIQYARTDGTRAITGAQIFDSTIQVVGAATCDGNLTVDGTFVLGGVSATRIGGETDAAWTAPTLLNSWALQGAPYMIAGYRKVGGRVHLRGVITKGSWSGVAFQLPSGYRPSATVAPGAVTLTGASAFIQVDLNGNVNPSNATSGAVDLSVVSFDTL